MAKTLRKALKSGQRLKKGKVGKTTHYITRAKALRKLQISLKDFRRLCILKGIFPREAPHGKDKGKIYYHVKDINYMQHEPILDKYRQLKTFMKKRARFIGRYEQELADSLKAPVLKLDHLVRERYPTSIDAIKDLDDPLNMLYLFDTLRTKVYRSFTDDDVQLVSRLTGEWFSIIASLSALRKVFVSIKGYYFQAQIHNVPVTWLVPHQAMQLIPKNVDFDIMTTFLHFYITMVRCVNFKLSKEVGITTYPLEIPSEEAVAKTYIEGFLAKKTASKGGAKGKKATAQAIPQSVLAKATATAEAQDENSDDDDIDGQLNPAKRAQEDDKNTIDEFTKLDPSQSLQDIEKESTSNVFRDCVFLVGREVSFEPIAFVIRCGGGIAIHETALTSVVTEHYDNHIQRWLNHSSFTHQVIDRPSIQNKITTRSYIQPQWIFDSFNMRSRLPIEPYTVGVKLPPHLSPFVDNVKENYIPAQLNQLRQWVGLAPLKDSVIARISDEEAQKQLERQREEQAYLLEMQKEMEASKATAPAPALPSKKSSRKRQQVEEEVEDDDDEEIELDVDGDDDLDADDDSDGEIIVDDVSDDDFDEETYMNESDDDDNMEDVVQKPRPTKKPSAFNPRDNDKQLAKIMMKKNDRRLHNRMMFGITAKAKKAQVLHEKREAAEKGIKNPKLTQLGSRLKRQR